jgi:hypothetical protein
MDVQVGCSALLLCGTRRNQSFPVAQQPTGLAAVHRRPDTLLARSVWQELVPVLSCCHTLCCAELTPHPRAMQELTCVRMHACAVLCAD